MVVYPHYDFHCHSTSSDGTLSPVELVELAVEKGIECLALTDHDTVAGTKLLLEKQAANELPEIKLLPGAEFTCLLDRQVLHIVGLDLNLKCSYLSSYLCRLDELRLERAERIAGKLVKKKLPNILQEVLDLSAGGQIARPHFAKVLCNLGIVKTQTEAFDKYLGRGKVGDVSVDWPSLEELISVIKHSEGLSILAHPTKYKLTMSKLRKVISRFHAQGGDAIEISYPGVTKEQQNILKHEVLKHDMMVSAGSDFHDPEYKWTDLGCYPMVPEGVLHVLDKCKRLY